jgi:integrase
MHAGRTLTGDTGWAATERNRKSAQAVEAEAWRGAVHGAAPALKAAIRFSDASEVFLPDVRAKHQDKPNTYRRVEGSFTSLCTYFGNRAVLGITSGDVAAYATWRATGEEGIAPVKPVTIRHDLHSLSKFFKYAIKRDWALLNPVLAEDIPSDANAVRMNVLTPEQERLYFDAVRLKYPKLHDLCRLMLLQGCRPEELLSAEVSHVNMERQTLRIVDGKSAAAKRTLKLRGEALDILTRRVNAAKGRFIFCAERNPVTKLSLSTIETQHGKVKVPGVTCVPYDMRHTYATRAANSGMSIVTLAKTLGHSSLRSVMKYVHPDQQSLDAAILALDAASTSHSA